QGKKLQSTEFKEVQIDSIQNRVDTGFSEINDILGGGLMPGSVILVSGEPGIGKSTLLLQLASFVAAKRNVLYVTGEESTGQIKLRGDRLSVTADKLQLASSTSADDIAATIRDGSQALAIVDSIQTMMMADIASAPGTVSQITNAT